MLKFLLFGSLFIFSIIVLPLLLTAESEAEKSKNNKVYTMEALSPDDKRIIIDRGTEAPFSGKLLKNKEQGNYLCRQCGQALFKSTDKFDSGTGWPSFDDHIPGAVSTKPDPDGKRVEIVCANCDAHLGHVFKNEGMTAKNTRHCVNSVSLAFVPEKEISRAVFAGGCFWGIEDAFSQLPGVMDVVSGYTGGQTENPDYKQVSTGKTGHAEAVRISYDATKIDYETLAHLFFEIHDPTQLNRQGPDKGTQYRSAIFYADEKQKQIAEDLVKILGSTGLDVVTQIDPLGNFYEAEDYHQDYTRRTGRGACHIQVKRFPD